MTVTTVILPVPKRRPVVLLSFTKPIHTYRNINVLMAVMITAHIPLNTYLNSAFLMKAPLQASYFHMPMPRFAMAPIKQSVAIRQGHCCAGSLFILSGQRHVQSDKNVTGHPHLGLALSSRTATNRPLFSKSFWKLQSCPFHQEHYRAAGSKNSYISKTALSFST